MAGRSLPARERVTHGTGKQNSGSGDRRFRALLLRQPRGELRPRDLECVDNLAAIDRAYKARARVPVPDA